ncbi:MAG: metallophosphoesterase [Novosphingobium sp.]|nr:metallophosphoesterase [Novosphingobium sp.]
MRQIRFIQQATIGLALTMLPACAIAEPPTAASEVPRTAGPLEPDRSEFRFAIVGDRTGGHRPGVFADAMAKLELLQPDFTISVGDLIEGYTEDEAEISRQWDELDSRLATLTSPFFFIAGNHDISNEVSARIWRERRGAPYWSFEHKGVLFLGLSTEDPPVRQDPKTIKSARNLEKAMAADAEATQSRLLEAVRNRGGAPKLPGEVAISDAQVEFMSKALAAHADARWTFLIMHKPAWQYASAPFARIEEMLEGRPYTVIAGHEHYYGHETRNGRDYIVMGTTGGVWLKDGPGRVDHLAMVTMAEEGPVMVNLRTDGIFGKEGQAGDQSD